MAKGKKILIAGALTVGAVLLAQTSSKAANAYDNLKLDFGLNKLPEIIRGKLRIHFSVQITNYSGFSFTLGNFFTHLQTGTKNAKTGQIEYQTVSITDRSELVIKDGKSEKPYTSYFDISLLSVPSLLKAPHIRFLSFYEYQGIQLKTAYDLNVAEFRKLVGDKAKSFLGTDENMGAL